MSYLEQALKDLEIATAALAKMPVQNVDGVQAILARRSRAIERLAELKDAVLALLLDQQAQIVQRMRHAYGGGESQEWRRAASRREALADWRQRNQNAHSLPARTPAHSE